MYPSMGMSADDTVHKIRSNVQASDVAQLLCSSVAMNLVAPILNASSFFELEREIATTSSQPRAFAAMMP